MHYGIVLISVCLIGFQSELLELQQVLEQQTSELQSVKQQQERAGTTITDQMYLEAQV